jgi:GNAT superfamily N-acetyltransferase
MLTLQLSQSLLVSIVYTPHQFLSMSPLVTKLSPLLPQHYESVWSHLQKLDGDDRYHRFGSNLSDESIEIWVKEIQWDQSLLFGAWLLDKLGRESQLIGVLHLEPTGQTGVYELALSVLPSFRKQGIATSMLATLMQIRLINPIEQLIAFKDHPALKSIINSIELQAYYSVTNPKISIDWPQSNLND